MKLTRRRPLRSPCRRASRRRSSSTTTSPAWPSTALRRWSALDLPVPDRRQAAAQLVRSAAVRGNLGARAREIAAELHAKVRLGQDPAGRKAEERVRASETMGATLDAYLATSARACGREPGRDRAAPAQALPPAARPAARQDRPPCRRRPHRHDRRQERRRGHQPRGGSTGARSSLGPCAKAWPAAIRPPA